MPICLPCRKCRFDSGWVLLERRVGKPGIEACFGSTRAPAQIRPRRLSCGGTRVGTGRRLLTALAQVRFLPPQLRTKTEGQANGRWQPPRKRSSSNALGVRLSLLPPTCPWPSGKGSSLPSWRDQRCASVPGSTLAGHSWSIGDRLTVGRLPLKQVMEVQVLLPELRSRWRCPKNNPDPVQLLLVGQPSPPSDSEEQRARAAVSTERFSILRGRR